MKLAWVIGSGGLVGRALCRSLDEDTVRFHPDSPFRWNDEVALQSQFREAVQDFANSAPAFSQWQIYWTAGIGTFASKAESMAQETRTLGLLAAALRENTTLRALPGCIALASSAGAIYAGSRDFMVTENTVPAPTTAYAREKLVHEAMLAALVPQFDTLHVLLGRISTIYGSGPETSKSQGLLTHIARCVIRGEPVHIYVPFDTIRDYIAVDDVARELVALAQARPAGVTVKLIASEMPTTIAEIIGIFRRVAKRHPRVITSATPLSALYAKRILFSSVLAAPDVKPTRTPLLVGISQLLREERRLMQLPSHTTGMLQP